MAQGGDRILRTLRETSRINNPLVKKVYALISSPYSWVALLTFLGAMLRRYHLAAKSLWLDEAVLYHISQGSLLDILDKNATMSSAPPFYPFLLRGVQIFGDTELVLRGLAMAAGIVSIPVAYFVFRKFLSPLAALGATLFVTIAPSQITYSQQVREYSLTVLFSLLMLWTTWNFIHAPRWRNVILLVLAWLPGIWMQYGLAVLALSLNIIAAIFILIQNNYRSLVKWAIGQIPILASVIIIYVIALSHQYVSGGSGIQYLAGGYWDPAQISLTAFIKNQTVELLKFTFPEVVLFSAVIIIGLTAAIFHREQRGTLLWIFVPVLLAIALGLLRMYPYMGSRHDIYLTPLLFLACGLGIDYFLRIDPKKITAIVVVIILTFAGVKADIQYYQSKGVENIRPVLAQLTSQYQPGDQVYVYCGAEWQFRYYMRDQQLEWIPGKWHREKTELYFRDIDPIVRKSARTWLVFSHCYMSECVQIHDYVASIRQVDLVAEDNDVWLYLAP